MKGIQRKPKFPINRQRFILSAIRRQKFLAKAAMTTQNHSGHGVALAMQWPLGEGNTTSSYTCIWWAASLSPWLVLTWMEGTKQLLDQSLILHNVKNLKHGTENREMLEGMGEKSTGLQMIRSRWGQFFLEGKVELKYTEWRIMIHIYPKGYPRIPLCRRPEQSLPC